HTLPEARCVPATCSLRKSFGIIPVTRSFASSAFPVPPCESFGSLPECSRSPWEQYPLRHCVPQGNGAEKGESNHVSQSRPTHRLPRERSGKATSTWQWREFHRAVSRHATVVEGLERRVAV